MRSYVLHPVQPNTVYLVVALVMGIMCIYMLSTTAPLPPVIVVVPTVSIVPTTLEEAKNFYDAQPDIKSLLIYAQFIGISVVMTDSLRASTKKHFYCAIAKEAGTLYKVRWNILYGLWMRESEVNPTARGDGKLDKHGKIIRNTYKAFGLGQIHLKTAQLHYDPKMTEKRLMDPVENGMASAKILRDYTDMFNGNIRYGISAYQQGPANTMKQYHKGIVPQNINYVVDVLQNAAEVN